MRAIFQKMAKTIITKGKIFENLDKMYIIQYIHIHTLVFMHIFNVYLKSI